MKIFNPIIVDSLTNDPYRNNNKYIEKKRVEIDSKGKKFTKITYLREHKNPLWKVKNAFLGLLGYLSVIAVILDHKGVNKLWKRAQTGEEIKVVLLRKNTLKPILKKVRFDPTLPPDKSQSAGAGINSGEMGSAKTIHNVDAIYSNIINSYITEATTDQPPNDLIPSEKIQKREYPPISMADTVIFDRETQTMRSVHGNGQLFKDEEILEKLEIQKIHPLQSTKILVKYTNHNKPIIKQQAQRGCTAAVVAMLVLEKGGSVDLDALRNTNLGTEDSQLELIKKANFKPISIEIDSVNYLEKLKAVIEKNGSAIVGISGELGGHVIVVDAVSNDLQRVRLRDPYHGWEITVSGASFMQRKPSYVLQIQ